MTTSTVTATNSASTDAEFRALVVELQTQFAAIGLVQAADSGQIDSATVLKPSSNGVAGYEIWKFNDALQATAPVFLKIEYGFLGANIFQLWLTVGTGSDGAGTLTGTVSTRVQCSTAFSSTFSARVCTNYLCYKDGFLGLIHKFGFQGSAASQNGFAVCRTCDGTGAWTGDGCVIYTRQRATSALTAGVPVLQALRFAAPASAYPSTASGGFCIAPHSRGDAIGADVPIFLHWMPVPEMVPVLGLCSHLSSTFALGTFSATLVGSTARTYFTVASNSWLGYGTDSSSLFSIAMLWE